MVSAAAAAVVTIQEVAPTAVATIPVADIIMAVVDMAAVDTAVATIQAAVTVDMDTGLIMVVAVAVTIQAVEPTTTMEAHMAATTASRSRIIPTIITMAAMAAASLVDSRNKVWSLLSSS